MVITAQFVFLSEPQSTGYSNFQTPFVPSNPQLHRDSSSNLYDYQEPAHQSYIPVSQSDRSQIDSAYETPNAGYNAPSSSYYSPGNTLKRWPENFIFV